MKGGVPSSSKLLGVHHIVVIFYIRHSWVHLVSLGWRTSDSLCLVLCFELFNKILFRKKTVFFSFHFQVFNFQQFLKFVQPPFEALLKTWDNPSSLPSARKNQVTMWGYCSQLSLRQILIWFSLLESVMILLLCAPLGARP